MASKRGTVLDTDANALVNGLSADEALSEFISSIDSVNQDDDLIIITDNGVNDISETISDEDFDDAMSIAFKNITPVLNITAITTANRFLVKRSVASVAVRGKQGALIGQYVTFSSVFKGDFTKVIYDYDSGGIDTIVEVTAIQYKDVSGVHVRTKEVLGYVTYKNGYAVQRDGLSTMFSIKTDATLDTKDISAQQMWALAKRKGVNFEDENVINPQDERIAKQLAVRALNGEVMDDRKIDKYVYNVAQRNAAEKTRNILRYQAFANRVAPLRNQPDLPF